MNVKFSEFLAFIRHLAMGVGKGVSCPPYTPDVHNVYLFLNRSDH